MVQWQYRDWCVVLVSRAVNVCVAAFTAAYSCMTLYDYMEKMVDPHRHLDLHGEGEGDPADHG